MITVTRRDAGPIVLWGVIILLVGAWSAWRAQRTALAVQEAETGAACVAQDLQRLASLRSLAQGVAAGRRPDADVISRIQKALVEAGLPIEAASGIQPRIDQVAGSGMRLQVLQLKLQGLDPAGLGAWLAAWQRGDQSWQVTEIQMVHAVSTGSEADRSRGAVEANRFDIHVTLAVPYWEETT